MAEYTKQLYRIGEVSTMLNLPVTTIKYWTDTFEEIRPRAIGTGRQVKYRLEDIEMIRIIKSLMHDKKMRIDGAKAYLARYCGSCRLPKCESAEDALVLLQKASAMVNDNPKASVTLNAICAWLRAESVQNKNKNQS